MDPLAELQDIHLPEAASWWPPAPGWILIVTLLIIATGFFATRWFLARRRNRYRRVALAELEQLETADAGDQTARIQIINALLKRVALRAYPRAEVAALHGDAWVRFLLERGGFSQDATSVGQLLAERAYQCPSETNPEQDLSAAIAFARQWIRRHP